VNSLRIVSSFQIKSSLELPVQPLALCGSPHFAVVLTAFEKGDEVVVQINNREVTIPSKLFLQGPVSVQHA
jgi:hypothetical protein